MRRGRRWASATLGFALSLALSDVARASGPLGPEGSAFTTSDYAVDLSEGVVLAGTRVLGLAGAYVAIAEGVDGNTVNAAAPAVRTAYSLDHVDYDIGVGVTLPASIRGNDLFNSGVDRTKASPDQSALAFIDIAGNLQIGHWGVGLSVDYQQYQVTPQGQSLGLQARFGGVRLQAARSFFDGQLVLGLGSRGTGLRVTNPHSANGEPEVLFEIQGANTEVGALVRPNDLPLRIGAAFRSKVITTNLSSDVPKNIAGDRVVTVGTQQLYLPNSVELPWDLNMGLAVQLGSRPLNPRWIDPADKLARLNRYLAWHERERERRRRAVEQRAQSERRDARAELAALDAEQAEEAALDAAHRERAELAVRDALHRRYREMQRFYVLVSSSLLVTGPADNAVGVESFLTGTVQRSGERTTVSPRLGVESEIVPNWLTVRAGTYGEPTRFSRREAHARLHTTLGFDVKLFPWNVFGLFDDGTEWRLSAAMDGAKRYFSWGASVGVWH